MVDFDALGPVYAAHLSVDEAVARAIIEVAARSPATRVLEVGCGTANYSSFLARSTGTIVVGVDASPGMVSQVGVPDVPLFVVVGDAASLPLASDQFDVAFAVDVVHHLSDLPALLTESHRVLATGGWLVLATESADMIRQRLMARYFPGTVVDNLRRYPSIDSLVASVSEAGFIPSPTCEVESRYVLEDASAYEARVYSVLHTLDTAEFASGLRRLKDDLSAGPLHGISRHALVIGQKPAPNRAAP